jgi:hypothetical protein
LPEPEVELSDLRRTETLMPDKATAYRTKTGRLLTEADIEAMADEAERGYDIEVLKTRPRGHDPSPIRVSSPRRSPYHG